MARTKFGKFVTNVSTVVSNLDINEVKHIIGDSTKNNRNLTVRQLIRYLESSRKHVNKDLAKNINLAYNTVKSDVQFSTNRFFNSRTDAIDVTEFIQTLTAVTSDTARIISRNLV